MRHTSPFEVALCRAHPERPLPSVVSRLIAEIDALKGERKKFREKIQQLETERSIMLSERLGLQNAKDRLEKVLKEEAGKASISFTSILSVVSEQTGTPTGWLISHRRDSKVVLARHMVIYLARTLLPLSLPQLGAALGGRDHSTILKSYQIFQERLARDAALSSDISLIIASLTQREAA